MKQYLSIQTLSKKIDNQVYYCFDKLDGSNIRAEWTKKEQKFVKFGRRHGLLDDSTPILKKSIKLIQKKYETSLNEIFLSKNYDKVVCFFEFFGKNSFAGNHDIKDEHDVVLIDVNIHKKGFLSPKEFIENFDHLGIPKLLYKGIVDNDFISLVKEGVLPEMTFEGVVCKTLNRKKSNLEMFKIKNKNWILKLKEKCGNDEKLFNKLV